MTKKLLPLLKSIINLLPFGRFSLYRYISKIDFGEFVYSAGGSNSFQFICNIKDPISRVVYFSDTMEPQIISIIEKYLKSGMTFVDVGASWGYYSMLASRVVGEKGRAIALEPDARYSKLLKKNIELNSIGNITVYNIAAGRDDGFVRMGSQPELRGDLCKVPRVIIGSDTLSNIDLVKCKKLDDILRPFLVMHHEKISFLKMNIEGAEFEALIGMSDGLKNKRYERMLIEFHPHWLEERGASTEILVNKILLNGYKGWWIQRSRSDFRRLMYSKNLPDPKDFLLEMRDGNPPDQDLWPCAYFVSKDILI